MTRKLMFDAMQKTVATTNITSGQLDTNESQVEITTINAQQDLHACQLSTTLDIPSYESNIPPTIMTEAPKFKEQLDAFNLNLPLPLINLEDAYDFASLLFSPL
jgi:hypothetical protein